MESVLRMSKTNAKIKLSRKVSGQLVNLKWPDNCSETFKIGYF